MKVLRRVMHVRQLNGLINTQRQEQLYNVFNKDNRFLNSMTPVNHIFLFRSNIDMMNERINQNNIHNIQILSPFNVTENQFGWIVLDKTTKIPSTATAPSIPTHQNDIFDTSPLKPEKSGMENPEMQTNLNQPPSNDTNDQHRMQYQILSLSVSEWIH